MGGIEDSISRYERWLDNLPSPASNEYEQHVWEILLARDEVANALAESQGVTASTFGRVAELDRRLKDKASVIRNTVGANKLLNWREVKSPPERSWWWFLDERVVKEEAEAEEKRLKYDAVWILLTFFFVTVSLSLLTEITRRFFSGEGEWVSILGSVVQVPLNVLSALLGLLTVGTITEAGRHGVQGVLQRAGLFKQAGVMRRFAIALALFCLVFPLRLTLPLFAHYYNDLGGSQARAGHISKAIESYERAITLKPEYVEANYNLADAYERLPNCQKAISHYEAAIKLDHALTHAQNNLARLYLKCGNEAQTLTALAILDQQLRQHPPPDDDVRYSLLKNQGWARYKLKNYAAAESDLRQAKAIRADRGSAHCLLAYTLEAQGRADEAIDEWYDCIAYSVDVDVEAVWVDEAREKYGRKKSYE
ncbi:MAG TPA: tetratricopeptide repeat protein [Pyrinomonadaceae bacterium]|jgi:tetratricopeptide (TPR) repeat protein